MPVPAFDLCRPDHISTGVVFASPHSGRSYTPAFLRDSVLDAQALRSSEDAFVDLLFRSAPLHGAPLLCAAMPRAWLDLNRAASELDPALIAGLPRGRHNPRVASGLGVVPRVVAGGRQIYRGKITEADARDRIRNVWRPYHGQLQTLLSEAQETFGDAILIDCHSMPHDALESAGPAGRRPQIVLGDRFGASAAPEIVDGVERIFTDLGLDCARNAPFAGAYIAQHYGRPGRRQHVVQLEIDRSLYMDEANVLPHDGFDDFKALLDCAIGQIAALGRPAQRSLAAE